MGWTYAGGAAASSAKAPAGVLLAASFTVEVVRSGVHPQARVCASSLRERAAPTDVGLPPNG
jgi:hypothetical protein